MKAPPPFDNNWLPLPSDQPSPAHFWQIFAFDDDNDDENDHDHDVDDESDDDDNADDDNADDDDNDDDGDDDNDDDDDDDGDDDDDDDDDFIWSTYRRFMSHENSKPKDKDPEVVLALGVEICSYGEPAY